ncbi:MFS transporter [Streptomyces sp. DT2A-34]|uniref:MFS transporter n=1 Tax=Streptomyces sp. DT2A-34 TaxID=3051182 RepID=UPI00265B9701|nr:MFS transporter [Streptomyces sp. DT2A-34]MDO0912060.1 MFS transporter [Streptomyces sp. DT2A-34]
MSPYRNLFSRKGSFSFTAAGFLARLPLSMYGISTVVMIATVRDSYALAGLVAGTSLLAAVLVVPRISRLIDRHGQSRVAVPATVFSVVFSVLQVACVRYGAPDWTLFATAVLSATAPNVGGMVRARWAEALKDEPDAMHTANALEQVLDEVGFIAGPILSVALCTTLFPEAGVLGASALTLGGTLLLTAQRRTEPPVHEPDAGQASSPLRNRGLQIMILTFLLTGAIFGSAELVTVAYTEALGHASSSGWALALLALGSAVAGLAFGALTVTVRQTTQFLIGVAAMAALMLPLLLADGLPSLAILMFVAGMATAPTMITGMTLVQQLVPAAQINEGMALAVTGLLGGNALGSAVAGRVVEWQGAETGYWIPCGAAVLALVAVLAGMRTLTRQVAASTGGTEGAEERQAMEQR